MNEWKDCYEWLVQCGIISLNIKIHNDNFVLLSQEIASALKDGTALCNFLNKIHIRSVINFSHMARNSQCLMRKNIGAFLLSLREIFLIPDADLFKVDDLYSKLNLNKVLYTLSILSQHQKVKFKFKPFVISRSRSYSNNDDYMNISTVDDNNEEDHDIEDYNNNVYNIEMDQIYSKIMDIQIRPSRLTSQKKTLRELSDEELLMTEEKFIKILKMLNEEFRKPLLKILSINDHSTIFKHVDKLYEIHLEFYAKLMETRDPDSGSCSSDCFINFKTKFLIYGEYCSHIPDAQQCIDDLLKTNVTARSAIEAIQNKCGIEQCKLRDLLVIPMQRILRYQLLVKSCIDNITEHCKDRSQLQVAYADLQDLALFVNEMKRDKEMLKNISKKKKVPTATLR